MSGSDLVIPSRRGQLAAQAVGIMALGVVLGCVLQWSGVLNSSPLGRLGAATGLPIVALAVSGVFVAIGVVFVRDSWNHRVILGADSVTVQDSKARYSIPYGDVAMVKPIALGSVVIGLRDPEQWLTTLGSAADLRRRTSAVIRGTYGADILIAHRELAIDAARFVELLKERLRLPDGGGV